ncbi:hypothetical protein [Candidatus Uabimicrobium sp. HlEnr_7]|uniref:hypothetical protein n=1 Tax=Candidatus Uabimicrobium helgolandensis TaxID=3095367 RepID=UPI0035580842
MELEDFKKELNQQDATGIIILQLALTMGVVFFSAVIFLLFFTQKQEPANPESAELINLLSIITGILAFSSIMFFIMIPKLRYKNDTLKGIFESNKPVQSFMAQFRATRILQIVILEGGALLGGVTCLLAVFNGVMGNNSIYWANLTPAVIMVIISLANLPTKTHLYNQFKYLQDNYSLVKR